MTGISRPEVQPPAAWDFPVPVRSSLDNGVPLAVFDRPGQHVASVRVVVPVPVSAEPAELEGVGTIVSRTMDEGTRSHSADEFAELLETGGVALGAGLGTFGLTMQVEVTTGGLRVALEALRECLTEPAFPEEEVDRHVRQRLSDIGHERADAGTRASLEWSSAYYESGTRAGRPVAGSAETVREIGARDCAAYHSAYVRPDAAQVVVAGDVDAADVHAQVNDTLGRWTSGPASDLVAAERDRPAGGADRIVFVHRPGSVQTQVHLGWEGPSRRAAGGWAPYPVLSYLVGGAPQARIDRVLREEKGYTYGFGAGFRPRGDRGLFVVGGSVRADATGPAIEALWEVLDGVTGGLTDEELRAGADYIGMTAPARYATADAVADEHANLAMDGLDTSFVTGYLHDLRTLRAEDLDAAWAQWSRQPRTLVLVGDAEAHADAVRALGHGDVTVV